MDKLYKVNFIEWMWSIVKNSNFPSSIVLSVPGQSFLKVTAAGLRFESSKMSRNSYLEAC